MQVQNSFASEQGNDQKISSGTLYLVGTPIGNLEDISFRAVRLLKEVKWIAAEDTRQTRKLLQHFQISTRVVSYHEHNKQASGVELIRFLLAGESVALVSDAGLPAISDPGEDLVQAAIDNDIPVVPIPGANAALSALIVSGLPADRFSFIGFLPRQAKPRKLALEQLKPQTGTLIFYESPHRIVRTLQQMAEILGNRRMVLPRELTKKFEQIVRADVKQCLDWLNLNPPRGEYCLIVQGAEGLSGGSAGTSALPESWWETLSEQEHVAHYMHTGAGKQQAIKQAAADRNIPERNLYANLVAAKKNIPDLFRDEEEI